MVNIFISACIFIGSNWLPPFLVVALPLLLIIPALECVARSNDLFRISNLIHESVITEAVAFAFVRRGFLFTRKLSAVVAHNKELLL